MPTAGASAPDYKSLVQDDRIHASLYTRRVDEALRMCGKKVVLVNAGEPLPNLAYLI